MAKEALNAVLQSEEQAKGIIADAKIQANEISSKAKSREEEIAKDAKLKVSTAKEQSRNDAVKEGNKIIEQASALGQADANEFAKSVEGKIAQTADSIIADLF